MSSDKINIIPLPRPRTQGPMSLEEALANRRSIRKYAIGELTPEQISQLLWSAQGITGGTPSKRTAPSAGARHPLELYLCRDDGVWRYKIERHTLVQHIGEDVRDKLGEAAWKQTFISNAPCVFAITANYTRSTERYGERGRVRYVPMDAGHAVQNMLLQAVAMGLGAVCVAAFDDFKIKQILQVSAIEDVLYLIPVGRTT